MILGSNLARGRHFIFYTTSKLALGSTQPTIQWIPAAPSLWVKWLGHLHLVSAVSMLRMAGGIPALSLYAFMAGTGTTLPLSFASRNLS
jgi:hypothetical protein